MCVVLQPPMSPSYLPIVDQKFPSAFADHLQTQIDAITSLYAVVCCNGNTDKAAAILRKQQLEQVSFERNTIWKDMVGQERRAATVHLQVRARVLCSSSLHCCFALKLLSGSNNNIGSN